MEKETFLGVMVVSVGGDFCGATAEHLKATRVSTNTYHPTPNTLIHDDRAHP